MRGYFGLGQLSPSEKSDILDQHRQIYDGYKTMLPQVSNTQPLYTQDYANDKHGITVNNKGEVKRYTNVGINEQVEGKEMCEQCGGTMRENVCEQCGSSMEGEMEESGHKPHRRNGKFKKHQYTETEVSEYETGHLDDIYHEEDLNPDAEFDYVKGASNKTNAFRMKEQSEDMDDYFEDPDNEDDGFEDINASEVTDEIEEEGFTGGGKSSDMDLSNIDPAYDFVSDGPMAGGDVYNSESEMDEEYETMESAFADDEIDEVDVSGSQGIYGDMDPAYDFDSEGPGKAGPYQRFSYNEDSSYEDDDMYWQNDLLDNELDLDLTKFNPEDKSWEEITAYTGDDEFSHLDEDIRESLVVQKNKIMEMMNRMKVFK
jgi:hypothetical protein